MEELAEDFATLAVSSRGGSRMRTSESPRARPKLVSGVDDNNVIATSPQMAKPTELSAVGRGSAGSAAATELRSPFGKCQQREFAGDRPRSAAHVKALKDIYDYYNAPGDEKGSSDDEDMVQDDICQQLRLSAPLRLLSSFNRPNISYTVRYLDVEETDEVEALIRLLSQRRAAGGGSCTVPCSIVYCQKRDTCEAVAGRLSREGLPAAAYHGQMREDVKKEVLRRWQADEVPVVVATIAFGMGIDKAGVRLVVHFNLPRSLEGFYQEAGRAGRDGRPAESVLFYSREARSRMDYVLQKDQEEKQEKAAAAGKKAQGGGKGGGAGGRGSGAGEEEEAAVAEAAACASTPDEQAQVQATAWQAFGRVVDWATTATCRRRGLLAHFGERSAPGPCGGTGDGQAAGCDFCRDLKHVEAQLEKLKQKELEAAAARRRGPGGARRGDGDDEESDMFAVRGGGGGGAAGGGGGGGGDAAEEGPSAYQAGRSSPQHAPAEVAEARAAAAAARAAAGGRVDDRYFAALAAREREHERRAAREGADGDVVDRMLARAGGAGGGGGGGGAGGGGSSAPPPDATARRNAVSKLAAALGGGGAGGAGAGSGGAGSGGGGGGSGASVVGLNGGAAGAAGWGSALLQKLAEAIEAEVYGGGLPRQQYTSRMAGLLSRARGSVSPLALLPQAAVVGTAGPTAALLPAILQAEVVTVESLLLTASAVTPADGGGNGGVGNGGSVGSGSGGVSGGKKGTAPAPAVPGVVAQAVARLQALAAVAVTVGAVAAGGVGKRVAKLGKHGDGQVAAAARQVVASWKRQLPEGPGAAAPAGQLRG